MTRTLSPELSPQLPDDSQIVQDSIEYFTSMKEALGDDSPHTREQVKNVIKFRHRNPYFNTAGYTLEAEPDVYAEAVDIDNTPDQITVEPSHNNTPMEPLQVSPIVPENILNVGLITNESKQKIVSQSPTHTLLFKDDTYFVVLPPHDENEVAPVIVPDIIELTPMPHVDVAQDDIELSPEALLTIARYKVADLSVRLRGKSSKKLNADLRSQLNVAQAEYKRAYTVVNTEGEAILKGNGEEHKTIIGLLSYADAEEFDLFNRAEKLAYAKYNPRFAKVVNFWAKRNIFSRAALGGGAGMAVTTVATGVAALTGVGLVAGGTALLTVKAAKSLAMYKVNKGVQSAKQFDKKAIQDRANVTVSHDVRLNMSNAINASSSNLIGTINNRIERDQKENRRKLVIAVGAVAVGALSGSVVHSIMNGGSGNHQVVSKPTPGKPSVTETTTPAATPTTDVARPTTPSNNPPTARPTRPTTPPRTGPIDRPNTEPRVPVSPTETPVKVPANQPAPAPVEAPVVLAEPPVDITRPTWSVAHDFAPGSEVKFMQSGIDRFNSLNGTNFALTPHNGSTWIIDNGRAISPAQMFELNQLMLEESLQTA